MGLSLPEYVSAHPLKVGTDASMFLRGAVDIVNTIGKSGMAVGAFLALFLDNTIAGSD